jgi:hypothetical protein
MKIRRRSVAVLLAVATGYGAVAVALSAMAGESHRSIDVSRVLDGGGLSKAPLDLVVTPTPPDPAPMVERAQWVFDLRWDRGDVYLVGVNPLELPAPRETPRVMGRFALELFEGPTLIERVRFDFPLLGPPEATDGGRQSLPSFSEKLRTRVGVMFPAATHGTRLELLDRATNRRWALPWPPPASSPAPSLTADAASDHAG